MPVEFPGEDWGDAPRPPDRESEAPFQIWKCSLAVVVKGLLQMSVELYSLTIYELHSRVLL